LPYAGGNSRIFAGWPAGLPDYEVVVVALPGRDRRFAEPAPHRMADLVPLLAAGIAPRLDRPYGLFGHSMGALIAFELSRELRRAGAAAPAHLVLSACRPPALRRPRPPDTDTKSLLRRLKQLGGTPAAALADPELLQVLLPVLRADFALVDSYTAAPEPPLSVPITAVAGEDDEDAAPAVMRAWAAETTGPFALTSLPGGHFFLHEHEDALVGAVAATLREHVPAAAHRDG
jgi:surfactin synthase thioesterase subunit